MEIQIGIAALSGAALVWLLAIGLHFRMRGRLAAMTVLVWQLENECEARAREVVKLKTILRKYGISPDDLETISVWDSAKGEWVDSAVPAGSAGENS